MPITGHHPTPPPTSLTPDNLRLIFRVAPPVLHLMKGQRMAAFPIQLLSRQEVAEGTMAFFFSRPEGFEFKAGQSGDFTLLNPAETDTEGNTRAFSFASPPHEPDLMITTRMRNTAFKRVLRSLPVGTTINLEGPFGAMTLHSASSRTAVFLAGGIGITPFRSMIFRAAHEHLPHVMYLFYANRHPRFAPFLEELQELQTKHTSFHLVATMSETNPPSAGWHGRTGHIDAAMLAQHLQTLRGPVYYIAGPPPMVLAMQKMLNTAGVDDDDIRSEAFSGY